MGMRYTILGFIAVVAGCASSNMGANQAQLMERASFDLDCPKKEILVTDLGDSARGVRGCGKQASYIETCTGQRGYATTTCTWTLDIAHRRRESITASKP